ncbi:MAG: dinitrogenase iron-molybdenum cofactor biosynthesis protein [Pseudomonadota bacterium]|nr:dinitrogenase iron-molybdenum cofactor biosynthesis protein [Pseudomonadota bacterium]
MVPRHDLSDQVALRIGLASRQLTGVGLSDWMAILIRATGLPLTPQRLGRLRLKRLRQASRGRFARFSDDELRAVIALLRGHGVDIRQSVPRPVAYDATDMPGSIRIACASNRGDRIDGPFGTCERFLIYQVSAHEQRLIDVRDVPDLSDAEDKHVARANMICDCHVLCALTIGGPATAKVVKAGMHPVKVGVPRPAPELIAEFQQVLESTPPPWLMKIMEASARETWNRRQAFSEEH